MCTPAQAHDALITQPHWQVGRRYLDVSAGKTSRLYDGRALRPSGWLPSGEEVDAEPLLKMYLADGSDMQCGARSACWKQLELDVAAAADCVWVKWVIVGLEQCVEGQPARDPAGTPAGPTMNR